MPRRAPRPCTHMGCSNYSVKKGKCPEHTRDYDIQRGSPSKRGYGSTWVKVRDSVLSREPLCRRCKAEDIVKEADLVHHRDGDSSNNAMENLEPLCDSCHVKEHHGHS